MSTQEEKKMTDEELNIASEAAVENEVENTEHDQQHGQHAQQAFSTGGLLHCVFKKK